jgi:hypothetical protein
VSELDHHHHDFKSPEEVVASLDLVEREWEPAQTKSVQRDVTRPDGEVVPWLDNVIIVRRRGVG